MLASRTIIQSPKPIIKIKRLPSVSKEVVYDPAYTEAQKVMSLVGQKRKEKIAADGFDVQTIQGIINQIAAPHTYGTYTPKTKSILVYQDKEPEEQAEFSPLKNNVLQSYTFSLSKSDVSGSFSITLLSEYEENGGRISVYDLIEVMDIVEIYECQTERQGYAINYFSNGGNTLNSFWRDSSKYPVFTGIVKSKKYIAQVADGGIMRRVQINGISAAGLVSQFFLNFDTTAIAISKQFVSNAAISKNLTLSLAENGGNVPIKTIVQKIWEVFCSVAEQGGEGGKIGTLAIKYLINQTMGSDFFDIDSSTYKFLLANVMKGESTQDFYSLIKGVVPSPIYEQFAYMDFRTGKMKVKIRQAPFSKTTDECQSDDGGAVNWTTIFNRDLYAEEIKSIDITQSDNEVYTVFFSYLNGYPVNTDKLMRIIALEDNKHNPMLQVDDDMYQIYGYRPLIATFSGYGRSTKESGNNDETVNKNLTKANRQLKEWFGRLHEMLSGNVTIAMTYDAQPIMPGEVIGLLGGQFYVEGISHTWNYGSGGEINLSVSRGGDYDSSGGFSKLTDFTKNVRLLEKKKNPKGST